MPQYLCITCVFLKTCIMKLLISFFLIFFACQNHSSSKAHFQATTTFKHTKDYSVYIKEAKSFCKQNKYNTKYFFLVDLSIHSGYKRFLVYDIVHDSILQKHMVSHGCGTNPWNGTESKTNPQFSNKENSHCSSLGKYVVLERGTSQWGIGINYVLQGLDVTNNNAMKRAIVLHSWENIPHDEVFPEGTPEGWGCPALSNESMKEIDVLLKNNKKVLLWIIH
jgi:L,D-transpeptidase catalytic domain